MPFWIETLLKVATIVAAVLSFLAACAVALLMMMNGNATVADFWDWNLAAMGLIVGVAHCALIVAGCRASWKFVDDWSDDRRSRAQR